ncbi:LppA family lipoprotein [Segniliparus rugosus]|uniref:Uncharacterized protein n=1 Tax=Segniliparus rugosus (strain ATCC BAA-974 / DSM 45345 / CCUG 50838 / CIP 108380 / JCM 13579 / CDC 945) TaxID=679197 RepID=E5XPV3_SEGRC|nr:LppA family lipoprotein [Segniliparus rugosus]EFV13640.1 hypothetical protein HMPREF9336_01525 [Segniliparus rugosus ATCC BAA-974]
MAEVGAEEGPVDSRRVVFALMRRRIAVASVGALVLACGVVGSGFWVLFEFDEGLRPHHMSPEQVRTFEDRFRRQGTYEEDQREFQAFMAKTADEIVRIGGSPWSWRRTAVLEACDEEGDREADTRVRKMSTDQILFVDPVPDRLWAKALDIVRESAKQRGMTSSRAVFDRPGDRSAWFGSSNGETLELASGFLVGSTARRLDEPRDRQVARTAR